MGDHRKTFPLVFCMLFVFHIPDKFLLFCYQMFSVTKQSFNYKKQEFNTKTELLLEVFSYKNKASKTWLFTKTACKVNTLQAVYFMITDGKNCIYNRLCVFLKQQTLMCHLTPFILSQFDVMSVIVFCKLAKCNIHDGCKIN